jgi:dethiobiotin synthetase
MIFVAGTGTEVGKTYVAKELCRAMRRTGIRVGVYKPVASGCIRGSAETDCDSTLGDQVRACSGLGPDLLVSEDAQQLWEAAGRPMDLDSVCPQRFASAVAPDEAARREGRTIDEDRLIAGALAWQGHCDTLVVEGAGGLFSPLAEGMLNLDLFLRLSADQLVLVAANRLGVIHEVIATCRAARSAGVSVSRLYLSSASPQGDASCSTNAASIRKWCPGLSVHEVAWNGAVRLG